MTQFRVAGALFILAMFGISCNDIPTDGSSSDPGIETADTPLTLQGPENLAKYWDNSQLINIAIAEGADQSLLESAAGTAADNWNNEVLENFSVLPRFNQVGGSGINTPRINITYDTIDWSGNGTPHYCGSTDNPPLPPNNSGPTQQRGITIFKKDSGDSCGGLIVTDLAGVIAHEFSEALGVDSPPSEQTVWCVANVPAAGPTLNKVPCAWEQQLVYQGYGVRTGMSQSPEFDQPIVRNVYIQGGLSIDTVAASDTLEIKARAYAGPEPSQPAPRDSTAIANVAATWTLHDFQVVEIVSQTDSTVLITSGGKIGTSYLLIEADAERNNVFPWPKDSILIVNTSGLSIRALTCGILLGVGRTSMSLLRVHGDPISSTGGSLRLVERGRHGPPTRCMNS